MNVPGHGEMRTPPAAKPRRAAGPKISREDSFTISKVTPLAVETSETFKRSLKNPTSTSNFVSSDFPGEDETLSLVYLVDKYSHLFPVRVKVVSGFMAESEGDPTLCVDDVYNIHAVKQFEVVTIIDSRRQKYNLPLHSAAMFGLVGDTVETYSVLDLHRASKLPPIMAATSNLAGRFSKNEVLLPISVEKRQNGNVIRVFSVKDQREKWIPGPLECDVLFSTNPASIKLYLSEIIQHASHLLPCHAQLYISQDMAKLPKHLTTKVVTIQPKRTETSLIMSLFQKFQLEKKYIDLPVSIDIDVRVLRPKAEDDYTLLFKDSNALVKEYDPTKLQACVNTNDDDTYVTQAQLLKAVRQGYETAGTKIKTSGVDHIYEPLSSIREAPSVYQCMEFGNEQPQRDRQGKKLNTTIEPVYEASAYEDLDFMTDKPASAGTHPVTYMPAALSPWQLPTASPPIAPRTSKQPVTPPTKQPKKRVPSPAPPLPTRDTKVKADSTERTTLSVLQSVPQTKGTPPTRKYIASGPDLPTKLPKRPVETSESSGTTVNDLPLPPKKASKSPTLVKTQEQRASNQQNKTEASVELSKSPKTQELRSSYQRSKVVIDPSKKTGGDQHKPDSGLQAVNSTLQLLLEKMERMEQKQSRFGEDLAMLKQQVNVSATSELPLEVCSMTQQDVLRLLDAMEMSQYKESFSKEWVDGEVFKDLDDEALQELGVASKLHRLKLMKVITGAYPLGKYLS